MEMIDREADGSDSLEVSHCLLVDEFEEVVAMVARELGELPLQLFGIIHLNR